MMQIGSGPHPCHLQINLCNLRNSRAGLVRRFRGFKNGLRRSPMEHVCHLCTGGTQAELPACLDGHRQGLHGWAR